MNYKKFTANEQDIAGRIFRRKMRALKTDAETRNSEINMAERD